LNYKSIRRRTAYIGAWNTLQIDYRSPYTVTFWSIAYAGFGHIMLDKYFRGFILLAGEIALNALARLNSSIFYAITGQFENSKQVLNTRWLMLYFAVYCFSILDSYREAVKTNNIFRLADRENTELNCFSINSCSFTEIESVPPYLAAFCSFIMPGSGCFLLQRMNRALYLMFLWVCMAALSGFYTAVIHTFAGEFGMAKASLDIQWFLNIPSLWAFSVYEAYHCALENNRLFRRELSEFLQREYQSRSFIMPAGG
jgi:hypothetical protein